MLNSRPQATRSVSWWQHPQEFKEALMGTAGCLVCAAAHGDMARLLGAIDRMKTRFATITCAGTMELPGDTSSNLAIDRAHCAAADWIKGK